MNAGVLPSWVQEMSVFSGRSGVDVARGSGYSMAIQNLLQSILVRAFVAMVCLTGSVLLIRRATGTRGDYGECAQGLRDYSPVLEFKSNQMVISNGIFLDILNRIVCTNCIKNSRC